MAKAMLVAQFDLVRGSLEDLRPGKLVNLAIFDVAFQGRPPIAPVVTLSWKDWKGEPTIDFPRRKPSLPASSELRAAPVVAPAPVVAAPAAVIAAPAAVIAAPARDRSPLGCRSKWHLTQPSAAHRRPSRGAPSRVRRWPPIAPPASVSW